MKSLKKFKNYLRQKKIDAYIIPKNDIFFSEEVLPHQERLNHITNFSGSSGFAVIISKKKEQSAIFSDGRYELQIEKEVDKKEFKFFNGGLTKIINFVASKTSFLKVIACDPNLISIKDFEVLKKQLNSHNINLRKINQNLVDQIWENKPIIPPNNIYNFKTKFSGKKSSQKILEFVKQLKNYDAKAYVLFQPDSLSWLLNLRDNQLSYSPVLRAVAIIRDDKKIFLFTEEKMNSNFFKNYNDIQVYIYKDLSKIFNFFKNQVLMLDKKLTPVRVLDLIKKNKIKPIFVDCPIKKSKSIKNIVEQENIKEVHLIDGLAFLKFWHWFETYKNVCDLSEEDVSNKLYYFRCLNKNFKGNSFATISAFGKNGAIVHYKFKKNNSKKIYKNNLLLIDSGGQYLNGTTDLTRTLIVGKPNNEMKNFYTYVLKGHLSLSNLVFPQETNASNIDALARMFLWKNYKDYDHGTGHGVGFFLNVHEGPISINKSNMTKIVDGMIISNEPGYYKKNKFGIRIENLELVKTVNKVKNLDRFLYFDTLTMVPYEKKLINKSLLNDHEINQINNYHKNVYKKIIKLLNSKEKKVEKFLLTKTSKL